MSQLHPAIVRSLSLLAVAGVLVACGEMTSGPDLDPAVLTAALAPAADRPACIDAGSGVYYVVTDAATQWSGVNAKTVSYAVYNTEDRFVVEVTYRISAGRSRASATVLIDIAGDVVVHEDVPAGSTVVHEMALPEGWAALDEVSFAVRQEGLGRPIELSGTYALVPICPMVQPVLWNRLSSAQAVATGEIGPGGTLVGSVNFQRDVMFGKGITPNTGSAGSGVDFPTTVVDPERGTIELWARFHYVPFWYNYGVYGFVNANHWSQNVLSFTWYNGNSDGHSGFLYFDLQFNGTGRRVEYSVFSPTLDTPVHLAVAWDRAGIDDTADRMRIYVDGDLVAASSEHDDWGTDNSLGSFRVATTWDHDFATDRFTLENLKVWDFARTDFSDRFDE